MARAGLTADRVTLAGAELADEVGLDLATQTPIRIDPEYRQLRVNPLGGPPLPGPPRGCRHTAAGTAPASAAAPAAAAAAWPRARARLA